MSQTISMLNATGGYRESDLSLILTESLSFYRRPALRRDELVRILILGSMAGGIGGGIIGLILTLVNQNV